jgi:hypothetical protein
MFGTADPGPRIAFLGSFGSLRPFGAELAITAFGLACQQMKQAGTLTNEQSSESAHGARDSTYQQNTTNIGRKPVEITARRSASSPEQPAAATENALRIQIWTALDRDPAAEMATPSVEGQMVPVQSGLNVAAQPVHLS